MIIFFFSSRRRHTRLQGDWSSDVCSSDLIAVAALAIAGGIVGDARLGAVDAGAEHLAAGPVPVDARAHLLERPRRRSEERRVGKECRPRCGSERAKRKKKSRYV